MAIRKLLKIKTMKKYAFNIDIDQFDSDGISIYVWTEGMKKSKRIELDYDDVITWLIANGKFEFCMDYSDGCGEHEQHVGRISEAEYVDNVSDEYKKQDLSEYLTIKQLIKL